MFEKIDARKVIIDKFIQTMPRMVLCQVKCLRGESHYMSDLSLNTKEAWGEYNHLTTGIFKWAANCTKYKDTGAILPHNDGIMKDGTTYIYGINKDGWLLATIDFKGTLGYKERGAEKAEKIVVKETISPEEIVRITDEKPKELYLFLSNIFHSFNKKRHELADESRRVSMMMSAEDYILFGQ